MSTYMNQAPVQPGPEKKKPLYAKKGFLIAAGIVLLAAVYEQTGRLAPVVGLHVVFNLLSVLVPVAVVAVFGSLAFVLLGGSVLVLLLVVLYRPLGSMGAVQA